MSDKIHPLDAIRALEESSALKACIEALERENAALRDDDAKMQLLHRQEDQLIAAERKVAELEATNAEHLRRNEELSREITGLRNSYWKERTALLAAEADKARLSEALRNLAHEMRFMLRANPKKEAGLYRQRLDEADAALSGSCSGWRVPAGWKLVPVELTSEMCAAGYDAVDHEIGMVEVAIAYRAMLAASPAAPQQGGE